MTDEKVDLMKGVQFVVDDSGEKTAVLIDLKQHSELWEDFYDLAIARERQDEPRFSIEEVKAEFIKDGKLP
jgi:hypothetical protein